MAISKGTILVLSIVVIGVGLMVSAKLGKHWMQQHSPLAQLVNFTKQLSQYFPASGDGLQRIPPPVPNTALHSSPMQTASGDEELSMIESDVAGTEDAFVLESGAAVVTEPTVQAPASAPQRTVVAQELAAMEMIDFEQISESGVEPPPIVQWEQAQAYLDSLVVPESMEAWQAQMQHAPPAWMQDQTEMLRIAAGLKPKDKMKFYRQMTQRLSALPTE